MRDDNTRAKRITPELSWQNCWLKKRKQRNNKENNKKTNKRIVAEAVLVKVVERAYEEKLVRTKYAIAFGLFLSLIPVTCKNINDQ